MSNPYSKILISKGVQKSVASVKRLDEKGQLYYMDYVGNYYGAIELPIKALGLVKKGGCSAFQTRTPDGDYITGRNYDMPHPDEKGNMMGVNVVLHTAPKGKYESISGADSVWLSTLGIKVTPGCYDDGETKITGLALLPFLCMDGMNEKGLTVSILALDLKKGEKPAAQNAPGKKKVIITQLVRYMLDNCATVEQAVALTKTYNVVATLGNDYHLFVSDANGKSAVFEWRFNEFKAVRTDACTNFYVGQDDAEDCYYPDGLKEKWIVPDYETKREYHYGYGHGYERGKTVIKTLNQHLNPDAQKHETIMTEEEARQLLSDVAQDYNGMLTSFTQYSVRYNNTRLTADFWVQQDYEHKYSFKIEK